MLSYILKIFVLLAFSIFVIYNYYFVNIGANGWSHAGSFSGSYLAFFVGIAIFYAIYKYIQLGLEEKEKVTFSPVFLTSLFFLILFYVCFLYFGYNGESLSHGFSLFFMIIGYLVFPLSIIVISTGFGKKILSYIKGFNSENNNFQLLSSLAIGFISFITLVVAFGIFGFYNLYTIFAILILFIIFSYRELNSLFESFLNYKIEYEVKEGSFLKLFTAEFFFILASLIFSMYFINLVRPFPIGWDDLGVYMNYPHLMAEAGSSLSLGAMYAWQHFTGIGYMFKTPTAAFFFNVMGGILVFISMILIFSDLFKSETKKSFLSLPIILATIFMSLPMVVFQQAKDMKVDEGLFFITAIGLYILYKYFLSIKKSEDKYILYILLIGILAGFAFTIKFTALLFIAGILALISFSRLGLLGLFGYISIFIGVFTAGKLWQMMNVVVNPENIDGFEKDFGLSAIGVGLLFLIAGAYKNKLFFVKYLKEILIFFLGLFLALSPWLAKNLSEIDSFSIGGLLGGKQEKVFIDLEKIHDKETIEEIKENFKKENLKTGNSITTNEDLLRYFGYEKGILNHVKMPWNLTMQKNQAGQFTDIGFLFLALIPLVFIFLSFKNRLYYLGVVVYSLFAFLVFKYGLLEGFLASQFLPYGYLTIFALFLVPTLYFILTLKDTRKNYIFILNLVFVSFYTFLWNISAFGIVWYGITMYFSFLLMIGLGLYSLNTYKVDDCEDTYLAKQVGSITALLIILVYIFNSVIPQTFTGIKNAGYKEYKTGDISQVEAKYLYHNDYLNILFTLNISENKREEFLKNNIDKHILEAAEGIEKADINTVFSILKQLYKNPNFEKQVRKSLDNIFAGISNPEDIYKNRSYIYRIGTFLKYHISENNIRLLEDSLVTTFDNYIYDENTDKTIENFKKLGVTNLVVDLNAATIDNSDDHSLTNRYERLLKTFTSDKLELIETDSICLKLGLDSYKQNQKLEDFMILAGINYESYKEDGTQISRGDKYLTCLKYIDYLITNNVPSEKYYSYLLPYSKYLNSEESKKKFDNEEKRLTELNRVIPKSYKVLFEIK